MKELKYWKIGLMLIIAFVMVSESVIFVKEYVFFRIGLNRDLILTLLWLLPIVASFIAVSFSIKNKIIMGLSYIPILTFLGPVVHFLFGQAGMKIDFAGFAGLKITFKIYFALSIMTIGTGCLAGLIFSRTKE